MPGRCTAVSCLPPATCLPGIPFCLPFCSFWVPYRFVLCTFLPADFLEFLELLPLRRLPGSAFCTWGSRNLPACWVPGCACLPGMPAVFWNICLHTTWVCLQIFWDSAVYTMDYLPAPFLHVPQTLLPAFSWVSLPELLPPFLHLRSTCLLECVSPPAPGRTAFCCTAGYRYACQIIPACLPRCLQYLGHLFWRVPFLGGSPGSPFTPPAFYTC